jgi:myo-inositol catabolism protein IolS
MVKLFKFIITIFSRESEYMQYRKLGNTNMMVSPIAFGCWAIAGGFNWGRQDEQDSIEALKAAYDNGINFFDTAEAYGNGLSEQLLGKALSEKRDNIIIAGKVSPNHFAPEKLTHSCEQSLKNLNTDRIDLYQLHWPAANSQTDAVSTEDIIAALEKLVKSGKIRSFGLSNYGKRNIEYALKQSNNITSNQLAYNLLFRAIEYEILPLCTKNNIAVLCYSSLMQGLLTGKFKNAADVPEDRARTRHYSQKRPSVRHSEQGCEELTFQTVEQIRKIAQETEIPMAHLSLAWLMQQKGVTAVIAGARNKQQAQSNAQAGKTILTQNVIDKLTAATKPLKQALGANADMWQSNSRVI